jgi:hypothetical protein
MADEQGFSEVDWGSIGGKNAPGGGGGGNGDRIPFMKFESGKIYTVRPVGHAIEFYKFFCKYNGKNIVVNVHKKHKKEAEAVLSNFFGKEIKMSWRCASFVLDRNDNNSIKVLEGGYSIFEPFALWSQTNGNASPGSNAGGNWAIKVTGDGVAGNNPRKYGVSYVGPAPITPDEVSVLKSNAPKMKFKEIYRPVLPEQIVARITGSDKEPAVAATTAGAPANGSAVDLDPTQW